MRRTILSVLLTLVVFVLCALPALAQSGKEASKGNSKGVLGALIVGVIFGIGVTIAAYRRVSFGEAPGHHEFAHDIREGLGGHDVDTQVRQAE